MPGTVRRLDSTCNNEALTSVKCMSSCPWPVHFREENTHSSIYQVLLQNTEAHNLHWIDMVLSVKLTYIEHKALSRYTQSAPALRSSGTRLPLRWSDMTLSVDPTSLPPMNTAGTPVLRPSSLASALSISVPRGSPSNSTTVAFTPSSRKSCVTV